MPVVRISPEWATSPELGYAHCQDCLPPSASGQARSGMAFPLFVMKHTAVTRSSMAPLWEREGEEACCVGKAKIQDYRRKWPQYIKRTPSNKLQSVIKATDQKTQETSGD